MNTPDTMMELLCTLYGYMSDEDKNNWCPAEAQKMVEDQQRYEIERSQHTVTTLDPDEVYTIIQDFINEDRENIEL